MRRTMSAILLLPPSSAAIAVTNSWSLSDRSWYTRLMTRRSTAVMARLCAACASAVVIVEDDPLLRQAKSPAS